MRVWDLPPAGLCRNHLLAEHRELHAVWSVLTKGKKGYSRHPEVLRWSGKLKSLYLRHEEEAAEMRRRGYSHRSPLDRSLAAGASVQDEMVDDIAEQKRLLRSKGCGCRFG